MENSIEIHSSENQEILRKFISHEVGGNVSMMVEFILSKSMEGEDTPFSMDDFNPYEYPEFIGEYANFEGGTDEQRQKEIERLESMLNDSEYSEETHLEGNSEEVEELIQEELDELHDLEEEPVDVLEWWIVGDRLAEKLEEKGEVIISDGYNSIWGRRTSGQAIYMDGVIGEICSEMEILKGQKYEW